MVPTIISGPVGVDWNWLVCKEHGVVDGGKRI